MANWQAELHDVVAWAEQADAYVARGLAAINANPNVSAFIKHVPMLARFETRLLGLVPGVGQALAVADLVIEDLPALIAFGAALHFAPADGAALAALASDKTRDMP